MDSEEPPAEEEEEVVTWRSVSQRNEYLKCGHAYKLHRKDKVHEKPAAWLPQGLGVHEAVEGFEKSGRTMTLEEMQEVYTESYVKHTNRLAEKTPNFRWWFRSGPYDGETDIKRRLGLGLEQLPKYITYTEKHPEEVPFAFDDGTLAVEFPFEIELGGVKVRGYIDQITWDPVLKQWVARDVKSGNKPPDDPFQLATYGVAFKKLTGVDVLFGDYFMSKTGKPTLHHDLSEWPESRVTEEYQMVDEGIKAEIFEPDPEESKCRFCPVNAACDFRAVESF